MYVYIIHIHKYIYIHNDLQNDVQSLSELLRGFAQQKCVRRLRVPYLIQRNIKLALECYGILYFTQLLVDYITKYGCISTIIQRTFKTFPTNVMF